jgi:hypothetical protein
MLLLKFCCTFSKSDVRIITEFDVGGQTSHPLGLIIFQFTLAPPTNNAYEPLQHSSIVTAYWLDERGVGVGALLVSRIFIFL